MNRAPVKTLVATATLAVAGVIFAAEPQPAPCATTGFRAFDFWVGQWDVHLPNGQKAGSNIIKASNQGCLLTEQWTGAKGGTGTSLNFYDSVANRWRQVWVSPGAIIDITGDIEADSMVLTGTITYEANQRVAGFRGTWTPLDGGRVRQFFEEQNNEGEWQTWFEGFYTRATGATNTTTPSKNETEK